MVLRRRAYLVQHIAVALGLNWSVYLRMKEKNQARKKADHKLEHVSLRLKTRK